MLKSVIFDIDNTLYDCDAAHAVAWQAQTAFVREKLGLSPERFEALHREAFRLQRERCGDCGAIHNRLIRCQLILEGLGEPVGLAPAMAKVYWTTLLENMRPFPGAAETLDRLRAAGFTLGVGTNMTADWQYAKLERLGLLDRFDFIVTSEEAGAEKPSARLFELCAGKAGCAARECAFVGDSLKNDVLGARQAGMVGIWLCRKPGAAAPGDVKTIRTLTELPELLTPL